MTATDATIASIGLPRHASPHAIAKSLRRLAASLEDHGLAAIDMVHNLSARGYPSSTLGDGGSRGSSVDTSTDRAVLGWMTDEDEPAELPTFAWAGADHRYASLLAQLQLLTGKVQSETDEILRQADDVDPTPPGTGECLACGRFVRPDKEKPGNRLRAGLCPTDYRAWLRAGQPLRATWVAQRRRSHTDEHGVLHTPEPDHDLDLTRETW